MTSRAHDTNGRAATGAKQFLDDAVEGLTSSPKRLPAKYFYDERGSALFDRICELEEYYLTRTELAIMQRHAPEIAAAIGRRCLLIEPGSGSSEKVRLLLEHLSEPAGYVPVDISKEHMTHSAAAVGTEFPELYVVPVHADFCQDFDVPIVPGSMRRVVYFPGSTIGNLVPDEAASWLRRMARVAGPGGGLLIGVDLTKSVSVLEAAYNDRDGVTRDFNLNVLLRLRNELEADVRVEQFEHRARFNRDEGRIEMHLISKVPQEIRLDHTIVELEAGETIHTENSYKYGQEQFRVLAATAGWQRVACWTDEDDYFSVQYFEAA